MTLGDYNKVKTHSVLRLASPTVRMAKDGLYITIPGLREHLEQVARARWETFNRWSITAIIALSVGVALAMVL